MARVTLTTLVIFLSVTNVGCDKDTTVAPGPGSQPRQPRVERTPDAQNGGDNIKRPIWQKSDIEGWTYHLQSHDEVAAFQFNQSGSVVATVGKKDALDYPALFWKIDSKGRLFISEKRDGKRPQAVLRLISIDSDNVVRVTNVLSDKTEKYFRKRVGVPKNLDSLLPNTQINSRDTRQ